eukprot:TRINITY_DN6096_c0_g1_i1.p2 TRINITY_DN6096_c0_g1~~TRINITY_DN6096_c0_g1_i1.p2  ORF type:complete len:153 (+),score=47.38 TRINITY_DN6096_c0_g1_i1:61-459(+)
MCIRDRYQRRVHGNERPFVYLKPPPDLIIDEKDKAFVLSSKQPLETDNSSHDKRKGFDEGLITTEIKSRLTGEEGRLDTELARELNKINLELRSITTELKGLNTTMFSKGGVANDVAKEFTKSLRSELSNIS